ncbi:MAG TPA: methionine--tRNA ligase [Gemmatimonadaceae bacterium]|nr:methionine--tRNA ligase [Gemmatimonadaceae bacterium]
MAKYFLTTAIDYANGDPHIGHAYEKIGADAIARYRRLRGDDVYFLSGLDEHGQKVAQAAADRGVSPQAFVDDIASRFSAMWQRLSISYDQFIRTTNAPHKRGVKALIELIHERNPDDFYEKSYEGWYCVGCELFKRDDEIVDGKCVLHPTRTLEWTTERNWFFRLTRYQDFIKDLFAKQPEFLAPATRRNEILALLEQGLEDISITRSRLSWAIPFPIAVSSGEQQGTWVWFDALPNYLTATGFPDPGYDRLWPAELHVIGKDITRLHCVIWPAMLEAAGIALPARVWAHGFVNLSGERFSKSAGVRLDLDEAVDFRGSDALRYFLLREVPFDADGDFSWERFEERYNSDLANTLGNLASRAISMVEKYCEGVVPRGAAVSLDAADAGDLAEYHAAMDGSRGFLLNEALRRVFLCASRGNEFVQASQPWALAKKPESRAELETVLAGIMRQLARHAIHLAPFMPVKAQELWVQLGGPGAVSDQRFDRARALDVTGWRVAKGEPLFPKPVV